MNLLDLICKELGVEVGEEWETEDGYHYRINKNGTLSYCGKTDNKWFEVEDWPDILTGRAKPKWKPKEGDIYYIPSIKVNKDYRYYKSSWLDDDIDQWYLSNSMVFKTEEEAIAAANKMLNTLKEEY